MKKILILVVSLISLSVSAQQSCTCEVPDEGLFEPKLAGEIYHPVVGLIGKEYFPENYLKGSVELMDGTIVQNKTLRYNGRIDGLLLNPKNSSRMILLDRSFIKGFCLVNDGRKYCFRKIRVPDEFNSDSLEIFGQILYSSKLTLYVYRRFLHKRDQIVSTSGTIVSKPVYGESPVYFFRVPDGKMIRFKSFRKRSLYKLFPGNKDLMKKLFRQNHQRRFRNEDDLIRISGILNELF